MACSAHNYTAADLQGAMYEYEIERRKEVTVTVDARHMGVGGTDTWSRSVLSRCFCVHVCGVHATCKCMHVSRLARASN